MNTETKLSLRMPDYPFFTGHYQNQMKIIVIIIIIYIQHVLNENTTSNTI